MQTIRFFSMAAVALIMGACSVEDNAVEEQAQEPANGRIRFEATIAAPDDGARTRTTYTVSGGAVTTVKWKVDDQIALIHQGIKETVQVSAVDEGTGEATLTGTITAPAGGADEEDVLLIYPAASVDATGSGTGATYNTVYALKGHTQDGTYGYISQYLDARRATGKIIKSGSVGSLKSKPKMVSEIAIWRLNLSDGTNPFSATKVTLKLGGVTVAATETMSTGKSDIYLCVVPKTLTDIYTAMPSAVFTIEATDGTNNYIYGTTSALSLATNTYYESPVTLAGPFTMAAAANDPTNDLGKVICTAGHIHANTSDDATCPATRVAMIAFLGSATGEAGYGYEHGLALAMTNAGGSSFCQWKTSNTSAGHTYTPTTDSFSSESGLQYNASHNTDDYPAFKDAIANNGTAAPTGCSAWFLPTGYQWNKMITACTNKLGTNNNHRDLRDAFSSRGGTNMVGGNYWSSTEYNAANAWMFDFGSGGNWSNFDKNYGWRVRSVLAF